MGCKLTLTPIKREFTESNHKLILGHIPQMFTTRTVKKLYPKDPKHIHNKLWCDRNAHTWNVSEEKRYWTINPMHVGVKLLDKHERTSDRDVTQWLPFLTMNDSGKVNVSEVCQNDLVFWMNTSSREVLWEVLSCLLIMEPNRRRGGIRRRRCPRT